MLCHVVTLRLFAQAREAAGTNRLELEDGAADTVGAVIDAAVAQFGEPFVGVVGICRVWLNGEQAELTDIVTAGDEVALLPPVSGG